MSLWRDRNRIKRYFEFFFKLAPMTGIKKKTKCKLSLLVNL